ncbi:ATP-binding protein [Mycolicibacterium arenosum]|uniref:AAA family ATPase n=1 Tax=Mycolicibacterium arenosum TaxID=2952157 RepID=A0ABT1M361_9MYCO|nr:AAA family ATPase [Mycolicibacterium sp. CAU 1645]MCP9273593.1 AAA family ATPase [Mycolicibacterium sp. CAU 1645]
MSIELVDPDEVVRLRIEGRGAGLLGRRAESAAIGRLLAEASAGRSGVLVVRGEAGIGKSALLQHARDAALSSGFRVESSVGVEAETQFAFAGLHQLCAPLLDGFDTLPDPQQNALGVALGRRAGAAPDRFLVGLAVLNLLAESGPMLCLIDDAQWLDQASAQVLAFVARRVEAERLLLMFAMRDPLNSAGDPLAGLPELRLSGLEDGDARTLLTTTVCAPLDERVRDRIVAEARGNPLALLELPTSMQLAGGFGLPDATSVPRRIEENFARRSKSLPAETQQLLLVAASEPTGDAALLWRAADHLGIDREAAAPAETAGLLEIDTRVRFRHPLVRSAVYRAATAPEHRRAHYVLAAATDPQAEPDRRAWHRAQSVLGTDEEAAAELERSADRALARGGFCAAAAFLERATDLTPEPAHRARRALDAASAKHCAGAPEAALALLDSVDAGRLDALHRARLELLRAQITFHLTQGSEVLRMLLGAARMLAPLDPSLARETYLQAFDAATITGDSGREPGLAEIAEAVRAAPPPPEPPGPADHLLDGLVAVHTTGFESGAPILKHALDAFREGVFPVETVRAGDAGNWLWLATRTASALFDDELLIVLADRYVRSARDAGALAALPGALVTATCTRIYAGDLSRAAEFADEAAAIANVSGAMPLSYARTLLDAWRGDDAEATAGYDGGACEATERSRGADATIAMLASAVRHNGSGNYPVAQKAAAYASDAYEPAIKWQALYELVEAASRAGDTESASRAMEELSRRAMVCDTEWAFGIAARSRALTSTGVEAEGHYRESITRLQHCRMDAFLARTHLVFGEWLRREGRRTDAREQLRTAHALLADMGAEAFAARAARELRATGERARKRTSRPSDALTAQELTIARLVATGATSREVGQQLFLSPRTIEAHLRNIFRKLGITSRRQLKEIHLP